MGTVIKHPVPERIKPSFVIFDIWALWLAAVMLIVLLLCHVMLLVVDYIESSIVPAVVHMLDADSPDEFRAEGVMVNTLIVESAMSCADVS